jgi:hypothetical protein
MHSWHWFTRSQTVLPLLPQAGKHTYATARYERLLRQMEAVRDYETEV